MNILFLTLLDFSNVQEYGIYTDLMREFAENGHSVFIVSPTERRKKEKTRVIDDGNVKILKLRIGNIQKTNMIEKGVSTLSLEYKFTKGIEKYFNNIEFDLVLYSTPPITFQKTVEFVKERDGATTYLLLKDIFPQNAVDIGLLQTTGLKSPIYKYFKNIEKKLYEVSDYIGCMSKANVDYLLKHNPTLSVGSVEVSPNSIEPRDVAIQEVEKLDIRRKYNIPTNKTIFIYGGNLGKPQGIDFLIKCIKANEYNIDSFFLIVGSGTEFNKLNNFFKDSGPKNSKLLSHLPVNDYEMLVNSCDVGMIFLDKRFTIPNFPSRILSYMQASMPVLAATDTNTDIGQIIEKGNFGYWCESNNVKEFNELVNRLCDLNSRKKMGKNAREYLDANYTVANSYEIIMKHFS